MGIIRQLAAGRSPDYYTLNKGSALISALFIMTLVAIAATAMSTRLQLDIYRTQLTIVTDKLYLASQAVSYWALGELANSENHFTTSGDYGKVLDFPTKLRSLYPDTTIKGSLYDLQSCFNLNNVSDPKYQLAFINLLKNTTKLNPKQRITLATTLQHWLTPYQLGQDNTLFTYYLKQKPPYYPAQQLMKNVSEFRLLEGVDSKLYRSLFAYITALPEVTPVNLNTATKPLLMTLGYGLNEAQVNELLKTRGKKGIVDLKKVNPLLQKLAIRSEQVTIDSQYFMSVADIATADLNLTIYVTIKRSKDNKGNITVSILNESFNSFG